jgi:hypothetical protein
MAVGDVAGASPPLGGPVGSAGERLVPHASGRRSAGVCRRLACTKAAQVSFVAGENGTITSLVLHQNGMNAPGKRLD